MRRVFVGLSFILLSACSSLPQSDQIAANWRGKSVEVLIHSWGQPAVTTQAANGNTIYVYTNQTARNYAMPMSANSHTFVGPGGQAISVNVPRAPNNLNPSVSECTTTFEVNKQHIIQSTELHGKNCLTAY